MTQIIETEVIQEATKSGQSITDDFGRTLKVGDVIYRQLWERGLSHVTVTKIVHKKDKYRDGNKTWKMDRFEVSAMGGTSSNHFLTAPIKQRSAKLVESIMSRE